MENLNTITISEYLNNHSIEFEERNGELITKCLFHDCDEDTKNIKSGHLYFNNSTGQYDCKKCGEKGNIITLAKFLGDDKKIYKNTNKVGRPCKELSVNDLVKKYHTNLPGKIRQYLNKRGMNDLIIAKFKLGYGSFYGKNWITIPVKDINGDYVFFKLRKDPFVENKETPKYLFYPSNQEAIIFNYENVVKDFDNDFIVVCEGEFDCMLLNSLGFPAITSTAGVNTFKEEWIESLKAFEKIYICFDNDEKGERGANSLIEKIKNSKLENTIYKINLPKINNIKDITDYFLQDISNNSLLDEFIYKLPQYICGKKPIEISEFKEMTSDEIKDILGLTIKKDNANKVITFLCCLSAYTEDSQFNISFNAPSSTGKSYIPTEISKLFPKKDVMAVAYLSPTAFFHEKGIYDSKKDGIVVNLSRKIFIFLDQPHTQLLERLRPLLSHDEKELNSKITNKTDKTGNRTKNVFIIGFPSVVFCSAGLNIDEQEGTRFLLLSPESNQEKIRSSIFEKIKKETDPEAYFYKLNSNPQRKLLKARIEAIRNEHINNIKIENPQRLEEIFLSQKKILKPRHQRDIGRLISIVRCFALLNLWFRKRENDTIIANDTDINEAIKIWDIVSESQEYNLPPFIYDIYKDVILPCYYEKQEKSLDGEERGLLKLDITKKYVEVYGRTIQDHIIRQQIFPMLESSGLIRQEQDLSDKRKVLIYPNNI